MITLRRTLPPLLLCSAFAATIAAEPAAEAPAKPEEESKPAATATPQPAPVAEKPATAPKVVTLPKIQVTATRLRELDKMIVKLDKQIAREKKKVRSGELDKALNNPELVKAAAIFGGNSAAYLEQLAARRVLYMETERGLLEDMKVPRTLDELKMIEQELDKIRTMRRELDDAWR